MKPGMLFLIARDIIANFVSVGVLLETGEFVTPNAMQDAQLASLVLTTLKKYGVTEPTQVDAAVSMLPLILQIAGVK